MNAGKVIFCLAVLAFLFPIPTWAGPAKSQEPSTATESSGNHRICARVNGAPIYEYEIEDSLQVYRQMLQGVPDPERRKERQKAARQELDKLIDREILVQAAIEELQSNPAALTQIWREARKEFERSLASWKRNLREHGVDTSKTGMRELFQKLGFTMETLRRKKEREYVASEYLWKRAEASITPAEPQDPHPPNRSMAIQRQTKRVMRDLKQKARIEIFTERIEKLATEQ